MAVNFVRNEIFSLLPHGPEFMFIESATVNCDKDKVGVISAEALMSHIPIVESRIAIAHFPGNPIIPGVLILEALMQTCALCFPEELEEGRLVIAGGVDKVRWRRQCRPGEIIHLYVELMNKKGNVAKFKACAKVADEVACEAEITGVLDEREKRQPEKTMQTDKRKPHPWRATQMRGIAAVPGLLPGGGSRR